MTLIRQSDTENIYAQICYFSSYYFALSEWEVDQLRIIDNSIKYIL